MQGSQVFKISKVSVNSQFISLCFGQEMPCTLFIQLDRFPFSHVSQAFSYSCKLTYTIGIQSSAADPFLLLLKVQLSGSGSLEKSRCWWRSLCTSVHSAATCLCGSVCDAHPLDLEVHITRLLNSMCPFFFSCCSCQVLKVVSEIWDCFCFLSFWPLYFILALRHNSSFSLLRIYKRQAF